MAKGAVHITGSNFACRRRLRWDILDRMRKLVQNGTCERPRWLEWVERAPPLETRNMLHCDKTIRNPYPSLVADLLRKYPHLRFEGCYRPDNQWQKGLDNYAVDHPVTQFVANQLALMNRGMSRREAFLKTEQMFYKRRMETEGRLKVAMALGVDESAEPLYTTGYAYLHKKIAQERGVFLTHVRDELRYLKIAIEPICSFRRMKNVAMQRQQHKAQGVAPADDKSDNPK
ncbi:hypothetical protein, conserved [Babesia bigemina]|uniref:Small ribosomal subunit protein mS23 n=1 Tax=Babesia bigemina TaxID=5866 RepID=A0A061D7D6_BABBI|nr:hypothetical protein, conserved [Babesia bigemina]CDR96458.1 hypothetical protein, conserved [Babesia bigemina]|eukprot:XP_012768644.1 hypothetical protein, conserved [Babesia bigemina]